MSRPRIRTLKPECWQDERVGTVSRDARLLWVALITLADDEGRFRNLPSLILGHGFPYDTDAPKRLAGWLGELVGAGLIVLYEVDRVAYGAFRHWRKHQKINRGAPSSLPEPPDAEIVAANALRPSVDGAAPPQTPDGYAKRAIPEKTRRAVARRYGARPGETVPAECDMCGAQGAITWPRLASGKPGSWVQISGLDLDHIVPEAAGGSSEPDNIRLLCAFCNGAKLEVVTG